MLIQNPRFIAILFLMLLTLASAAIVYNAYENVRSVEALALQALENTGLALSSSAETALRTAKTGGVKEVRDIFSDRVVAYAFIAAKDGTILFHTNPRLMGERLQPGTVRGEFPGSSFRGRRIVLETGVPAYEFDRYFEGPSGLSEMLRIVLHTAPTDKIVAQAKRVWWATGATLSVMWLSGILWIIMATRYLSLQRQLAAQEKMALIGQMTATLAHEVRNALATIKGYTQWVNEKTEEADARKAGLVMALDGAARIETLVNDLLLFSREEQYHIEPVEIHQLVTDVLSALTPPWEGGREISTDTGLKCMADREKLFRVLFNGLQNACQAMNGSGTLSILAKRDGSWTVIEVGDTGPGIGEEYSERLFTPFFTTKPDGTGLGLAYSRKVIEATGGQINLSNRSGRPGAVLTVRLPFAREAGSG